MITTKSNPKTELLLGASLDVLHQESREWIDTIAFWKDEIKFFSNILDKREATLQSGGGTTDHAAGNAFTWRNGMCVWLERKEGDDWGQVDHYDDTAAQCNG